MSMTSIHGHRHARHGDSIRSSLVKMVSHESRIKEGVFFFLTFFYKIRRLQKIKHVKGRMKLILPKIRNRRCIVMREVYYLSFFLLYSLVAKRNPCFIKTSKRCSCLTKTSERRRLG